MGYGKSKCPKITEIEKNHAEQIRQTDDENYLHMLLAVIFHETLDGVTEDGSEGVSLGFYGFRELVEEVMGDAADEGKWQVLMLIRGNIDTDEVDKALSHEVFDGRIGEMVVNKLRQTREETVCQRLTIDAVDNLRQR